MFAYWHWYRYASHRTPPSTERYIIIQRRPRTAAHCALHTITRAPQACLERHFMYPISGTNARHELCPRPRPTRVRLGPARRCSAPRDPVRAPRAPPTSEQASRVRRATESQRGRTAGCVAARICGRRASVCAGPAVSGQRASQLPMRVHVLSDARAPRLVTPRPGVRSRRRKCMYDTARRRRVRRPPATRTARPKHRCGVRVQMSAAMLNVASTPDNT